MSKPQVAVQMMMLKQKIAEDGIYNVLKKLSEMGFNAVELSQVAMTEENIKEMQRAIADFGMNICAISAQAEAVPAPMVEQLKKYGMPKPESLEEDFDKIVADAKALNCDYIRIGALPFHYMGKEEMYLHFIKKMDSFGERLAKEGMKVFYHNHHFEFEKLNGKLAMDILNENSNPEYVGFELDVHWIQRGGQNPAEWIKKLKGRVELVHLKDYRIVTPNQFTGMEDLFKMVQFAEVGEGALDFESILKACEESDVKYLPIEQDDTYGRDPYESLQISMDNLINLGYKNNF